MLDPEQLPHLLRLLDDDSPVVRDAVLKELLPYGEDLEHLADALPQPLTPAQRDGLRRLLESHRCEALRDAWPHWYDIEDETERLESALALFAEFLNGAVRRPALNELLDGLSTEFADLDQPHDAIGLADFLFKRKALRGTRTNYYSPQNSNLAYVIQEGEGIPISLVCVYLLVGRRSGIEIDGCNWPGHFLAKTHLNGVPTLIDCFNGGSFQDAESFLRMQGPSRGAAKAVIEEAASAEAIVGRFLANLVRAFQEEENADCEQLMQDLLADLEGRHAAGKQG